MRSGSSVGCSWLNRKSTCHYGDDKEGVEVTVLLWNDELVTF
ncbi:hypothetical protein [Vibrio diazotrophicus]|nr:hypothetical protein [Vibrio diazotrophicus]